ncbi:MAG: efflux RND transporter periplasmic adaptor subunit [bacterium]|nr:efflux RND transporter periplasmic adaptor subunit [bacterium]
MMSQRNLKLILPIAVVFVGIAAVFLLASSRKAPVRSEQIHLGPLVEVMSTVESDFHVIISGHGEVVAKVAVNLIPQVAGKVVATHPGLVAGGFFEAGETLIEIDARDYEFAVDRAQAAVARTQVTLEREQAEAEVARQEWDALNPGQEPSSGLVVREPQVRQSQAELEAARADLRVAQLNLERTQASLPFDGVVVSKHVDIGQFVGIGNTLATVYGTKTVEVRVPLEDRELEWFSIPRNGRSESGPAVTVFADFAGKRHIWEGRVARLEAEIDSNSRMVPVVVEVANPFSRTKGRPPLMPGTFVEVEISGRTLNNVIPVPRHAIREGNTVWVLDDGVLEVRSVQLARTDREQALVQDGLAPGDQVVVSTLDAFTDGMTARTVETDSATASTTQEGGSA